MYKKWKCRQRKFTKCYTARDIFQGKFDPPNFALRLARKDVALALELARDYDVPMEAATHAYNELTSSINRGWGHLDSRISLLLQEERAGNVEVRIPETN